ncbi:hypothetical protein ACIF70_27540 [Actinacidiphila glaucinigra]|uniref:hypothetical protein n=1 Tax=Actinacidiphila glaucinigra TaxID=235986 RepID=UPI0037C810E4
MRRELGPLEHAGAYWVIGDPSGEHLKLKSEGISHWSDGTERQLIAWSRLMNFGLETQPGKIASSKGLERTAKILAHLSGVPYAASGGARVGATLRNPYEDWGTDFDHHSRRYPRHHIKLVDEFLKQVIARNKAKHLGDLDWMSVAVDKLSQIPKSAARSRKSAIEKILDSLS